MCVCIYMYIYIHIFSITLILWHFYLVKMDNVGEIWNLMYACMTCVFICIGRVHEYMCTCLNWHWNPAVSLYFHGNYLTESRAEHDYLCEWLHVSCVHVYLLGLALTSCSIIVVNCCAHSAMPFFCDGKNWCALACMCHRQKRWILWSPWPRFRVPSLHLMRWARRCKWCMHVDKNT